MDSEGRFGAVPFRNGPQSTVQALGNWELASDGTGGKSKIEGMAKGKQLLRRRYCFECGQAMVAGIDNTIAN